MLLEWEQDTHLREQPGGQGARGPHTPVTPRCKEGVALGGTPHLDAARSGQKVTGAQRPVGAPGHWEAGSPACLAPPGCRWQVPALDNNAAAPSSSPCPVSYLKWAFSAQVARGLPGTAAECRRGKQVGVLLKGSEGTGMRLGAPGRDKAEKPAQAEKAGSRGGPVPHGGRCCQGGRGRLRQ